MNLDSLQFLADIDPGIRELLTALAVLEPGGHLPQALAASSGFTI